LKPKQEKGCIKFVPNFVAIPTLRRVAVWDEQNQQVIELITNHPRWTANTIGQLYKSRWQIEIFFREIKQLLHIKSFIGTTENAVMIQI